MDAVNQSKAWLGYKLANELIINKLKQKLEDDPGCDLLKSLQHAAATYNDIRQALGNTAAKSAEDANIAIPEEERAGQTQSWALTRPFEIIQPLCPSIRDLIYGPKAKSITRADLQNSEDLDDVTLEALNQRISSGRIIWTFASSVVLQLSHEVVVKIGPSLDLDHLSLLNSIKTHATSLHIPDNLGVLKSSSWTYIFMSKAGDVSLDRVWTRLDVAQKQSIREQLETFFSILRDIPLTMLSRNLEYGSGLPARSKDARRKIRVAKQTITTENDFNQFLCTDDGRSDTPWIKMIRSFLKNDHRVAVTHGDLHPRNIMVTISGTTPDLEWDTADVSEKEVKITGLIDWELAGCYPEYWEYVKALNTIGPRDAFQDWCEYLPTRAIGTWPYEFAIDLLLSRWLG